MHSIFTHLNLNKALARISPYTIKLLNLLLPLLFAEFVWFAVSFYIEIRLDPIRAFNIYSPMIEYLMMSLLLTIGGAAIFDITVFEKSAQ